MTSAFDIRTGFELELLTPPGTTRLELADRIAIDQRLAVELFDFISKVPLPVAATQSREALRTLILDLAEHHGAKVGPIAPDLTHVYLVHRAAKIVGTEGARFSVVHDNSLTGGERVAELVTTPLLRVELGALEAALASVRSWEGVSLPEGSALHVHVDAEPLREARTLFALTSLFSTHEGRLRTLLATSPKMTRAQPLPRKLVVALGNLAARRAPFEAVERAIGLYVSSRAFGLNLYNLVAKDPNKLTVELKLAAATLDFRRIVAIRELFVAMVGWALRAQGPSSTDLFDTIELAEEHRRVLC
ncbi:MAG: amidoligase family protein [Deltaproteobacteria bacterium]|nr:amidoligase family protein [Deltaproteobacteria bacterium]